MTRKLAATAIAIIVSIPLTPWLVSTIERAAGTDVAMVFPDEAWKIKGQASSGSAWGLFDNEWGPASHAPSRLLIAVKQDKYYVQPGQATAISVVFGGKMPDNFAGLNIEEPQYWGALQTGKGYDLQGATGISLDARSPDGAYAANLGANSPSKDRFFTDGRLRNAYQGGDITLPPGWKPTNKVDTVRMPGWYALDLPDKDFNINCQINCQVELEFVDDGARRTVTLERSAIVGSQRVAWIHLNRPGSLIVRANSEGLTPRVVGYAELIRGARDITLAKAELTVFFLCEFLPIVAWILTVCLLRALAYRVIRSIPRPVRGRATHEVDAMFTVAKWAGVGCYLIWTAKDVLSGVGIVFVS